jgi:phosphoribosyl-dephospho-CoA transferase
MWQFLTGVQYTTGSSDIDMVMDISHAALLDQASSFLTKAHDLSPWRLDAEISIPDLGEVHWKEWLTPANPVLVKSVDSVHLRPRKWFHQSPGE